MSRGVKIRGASSCLPNPGHFINLNLRSYFGTPDLLPLFRNDMGVGAIILNEDVPDIPSRSNALPHSGGKNFSPGSDRERVREWHMLQGFS
jgi:hypothetical protein